jgi:hypothetical protein
MVLLKIICMWLFVHARIAWLLYHQGADVETSNKDHVENLCVYERVILNGSWGCRLHSSDSGQGQVAGFEFYRMWGVLLLADRPLASQGVCSVE